MGLQLDITLRNNLNGEIIQIDKYSHCVSVMCDKEEDEVNHIQTLLKEIYDYLNVENEGVDKECYALVEKIRKYI